jgi:hypothetical protein
VPKRDALLANSPAQIDDLTVPKAGKVHEAEVKVLYQTAKRLDLLDLTFDLPAKVCKSLFQTCLSCEMLADIAVALRHSDDVADSARGLIERTLRPLESAYDRLYLSEESCCLLKCKQAWSGQG